MKIRNRLLQKCNAWAEQSETRAYNKFVEFAQINKQNRKFKLKIVQIKGFKSEPLPNESEPPYEPQLHIHDREHRLELVLIGFS